MRPSMLELRLSSHTRTSLLALFLAAVLLAGCSQSPLQPPSAGVETPSGAVTPSGSTPAAVGSTAAIESPAALSPTTPTLESSPMPAASASPSPTAGVPVTLANPGFEDQDSSGLPAGWAHSGSLDAVTLEERGRSGSFRLTHKNVQAYRIETSQVVSGLPAGWYTLRAWVRSSGGQNEAYLSLKCGGDEKRVHLPVTTPGYRWVQLAVSSEVTGGECTLSLVSDGGPDTWASFDDVELSSGRAALSILGADISSLKKSEDLGGVYKTPDGVEGDALQILKDHGLNYARLRVWVDPADGYHDKDELLEMALRLKALDIKLLVDFHYSDNWADPGKQIKPAAWADYDFDRLNRAVYDHTFDVCSSLVAQGTPPDMVQVGNEINSGMLWPDGHTWDPPNWDNLSQLLTTGYNAVKDCSPSTLVMLHIAEGGDNDLARWWFDSITRRDTPFDVIGISYYPYWHGNLGQLQVNLNDISARYDKDVIVVETSYAFTNRDNDSYPNIVDDSLAVPGYPLTPEGQRAMLRDVMSVVRSVPGGRGLGVFYWDAAWTAVPGNGWDGSDPTTGNAWENQALFDFDGRLLPAIDEYLNP